MNRDILRCYEAPLAEELLLRFEESILSVVQGGGGEDAGDEGQPGF